MARNITLPPLCDIRWALFGRHIHQDHLVRRLAREGFTKPIAIVSPDSHYERDKRLLTDHGLFSRLEALEAEGLVEKVQMETVNDAAAQAFLAERGCNCAFSTASRDRPLKPLIEFFEHRFFNLHDAYLPNERGGALNTWRILNDVRTVGDTIHLRDGGVDTGDIIFRHQVAIGATLPTPLDYDKAHLSSAHFVIDRFVDAIVSGQPLELTPQDNTQSLDFPRLYTEQNGAIDFSWKPVELERFVRAFSTPYPGAWCYVGNQRIVIKAVEIVQESGFHPFCNGRVVTHLSDGAVQVCAGGGLLRIRAIEVGGNPVTAAEMLPLTQILHTPKEERDQALLALPKVTTMV